MIEIFNSLKPSARSTKWLLLHLDYPHEEWCLIWPFSRTQNGYTQVGLERVPAHRIMCEYRHGPAPSPTHHAAHSCARGHEGCVNPNHVSWKTPSENHVERFEHSGLVPRHKITPEQVDEIRALKGRERTVDTAERYGVTPQNIRMIQNGKSWRKERHDSRIFSEDEVHLIRSTHWTVKPAPVFAKEFGVGRSTIDRIRSGKTYKYYPMPTPSLPRPER
jgi:hypothetical protein